MFLLFLIILAIIFLPCCFGITTQIVIRDKGYDNAGWFWLGFFFGIFALIIACAKPPKWCAECHCKKCNRESELYTNE